MKPIKEFELKIGLCQATFQLLNKEMRALPPLETFEVIENNSLNIIDLYFDTLDFALWRQRGYLRVRSIGNKGRVTFRLTSGPPLTPTTYEVTSPTNSSNRLLEHVRSVLADLAPGEVDNWLDISSVKRLGLLVIVSLENNREEMKLQNEDGRIIRVKFDSVRYPEANSLYQEIEITGYHHSDRNLLIEVYRHLVDGLGLELEISACSKLDRGLAIKRLHRQ